MRVGVLTTSYPRDPDDAAGAFVAGFTRWLAANVGDVEVLCADESRPIFYRGGAPAALGSIINWRHAAAFSIDLLRAARQRSRRWDAIVSHWLVPSAAIAGTLARGRRHLAIAHGSDARLLRRVPGGLTLLRTLQHHADLVYVAEALRPPRAPGRVAPMGIDTQAFSISTDQQIRARKQLRIEGFTILFLGRLIFDKGCDLAIDALPRDVTLLVAGLGPERSTLQAMARERHGDRVRFLGHVKGAARIEAMAAADAIVIPSRSDGAPTVALEAMAAGLPIVATRAGGIPGLLSDGKTALLCDPDAIDLRRAIEKLQQDTQLRQRLADNGKHEAQSHDWRAAGPRLWGRMELAAPARDHCIEIFRV